MASIFDAIGDLLKSIFELFAGIIQTILNLFKGVFEAILSFFTSILRLVGDAGETVFSIFGSMVNFIAANILLIVAIGVAWYGYMVYTNRQRGTATNKKIM